MEPKKGENERKEALLTFLQFTREGKFAKIEESSNTYARMEEHREELQEDFFYSIR